MCQDELFSKVVKNPKRTYTLHYKRDWLCDTTKPWHVYSKELNGGLCKICVLFGDNSSNEKNGGIFLKRAFQELRKSGKIEEHAGKDYHERAAEIVKLFIRTFEDPTKLADYEPEQRNPL